jgi:hypothetical protein
MYSSGWKVAILVVLGAIVVFGAYIFCIAYNRNLSRRNLIALQEVIDHYEEENRPQWPASIDEVLLEYGSAALELKRSPLGGIYNYVNWQKLGLATEARKYAYPMVFVDSLENYRRHGSYILCADDSILFDKDGSYIRTFLAAHPEAGVRFRSSQ